MKSEFDKDIDALLRRALGDATRREDPVRAIVADEGSSSSASHMDADELSAYAENALPAAARARYASHLADCDRCRRLATNIALASNVALKSDETIDEGVSLTSDATVATGWRARLAALFAPRTLSYALPVLAACVFAVVAFIALRDTRDERTQLAKHEPANASTAANTSAPAEVITNPATGTNETTNTTGDTLTTNSNTATTTATRTPTGASPDSPSNAPAPKPVGDSLEVTTQTAPVAPVTSPMIGQKQNANDDRGVHFSQEASRVPPPAQMSAPRSTSDAATNTTTNMTAGATASTQNRSDTRDEYKTRVGEADEVAASRARNEAPRREMSREKSDRSGVEMEERAQMRRGRTPDGSRSARARRSGEPSPEDAPGMGATRSAAGHRFRRQGGAWVDVRYDDNMSTTNVRRGTEQFRSLSADLPELERVADQLDGEVIVVIGNRAYRIR